jgi:DNA helicase HerA-like ATPase
MAEHDPTCIGRVRHVLGATVTVALDPDLAGIAPLWEGRMQPVGQVGSLVRIPQGPISLLATVTLVGISELSSPLLPASVPQIGNRWLQIQLLGEIDGLGRFRRGVSEYPGLDDPVHFTTAEELRSVYPPAGPDRVHLGSLAAAPDVPLTLTAAPLVTRHGAVVGSTGSGKTSAVATVVQSFVHGGWTAANIVIVDPHGEYRAAMGGLAAVRSVLGEDDGLLRVPYWALPAADILRAFCGSVDSATILSRFSALVAEARRSFVRAAGWLEMDGASVTADTPVPFDLRSVWYQLDYENNATYERTQGQGTAEVEDPGDPSQLRPAKFRPYGLGNAAPFKGPTFGIYSSVPTRVRLRLADPQYHFFQEPSGDLTDSDPLTDVLQDWLGNEKPISVLDFSGVPTEVTDLAIGVVLQLLFEVAVRSRTDGIGRPRPVLIVLEEAHRYLSDVSTVRVAREAVNRIAREGRKYGVGLLLVTQRPSELPDTALAQCGTIIALRLTNGTDQGTVKTALPDSVAGLADVLPALRTGEAIVVGEAVVLPTRVVIDPPDPEPDAADPALDTWRASAAPNEIAAALSRWRGVSIEERK